MENSSTKKTRRFKRLGLLRSGENYDAANQLLEQITDLVNKLGGTVVEIDDPRIYPSEDEYFLLLYEFKIGLENYLSQSTSSIKTLQSLIDFNNSKAKKMMPYFEQEIFHKSVETVGMTDEYMQALIANVLDKDEVEEMDKILNNQWFLNYGDEEWKKLARNCLDSMNILPNKIKTEFQDRKSVV